MEDKNAMYRYDVIRLWNHEDEVLMAECAGAYRDFHGARRFPRDLA